MPVYLAEVFMMFPMAYILVLRRDRYFRRCDRVSLRYIKLYRLQHKRSVHCSSDLQHLVVGALCGAVNGFILTRFKELPPMIVTLATQIIFRGIAEVTLGAGGSIAHHKHRWLPCYRWKGWKCSIYSVSWC